MGGTISLYDYIQSELQKQGFNEFVNEEGELVFFDNEYQFIRKMMNYDEEVAQIMDDLFLHESLPNEENDQAFKRLFLLKFMERYVAFQSMEIFSAKLTYVFLANQTFITNVLTSADDFITNTQTNKQQSHDKNSSKSMSNNRNAFADLPQNQVNIDLNDDVMEFASNNTISKNEDSNESKSNQGSDGETKSYQLENLVKSQGLLKPVFDQFDSTCFLQTW